MRRSDCQRVSPQHAAASRTSCGIVSKARCIGWMAKGRLKTTEATQQALEAEDERAAEQGLEPCPTGEAAPRLTSR